MNRNRDLDGNGHIDDREIRWYLPTSNVYQQIAIAQGELPDPLINFAEHSPYELKNVRKRDGKESDDRWGSFNYHYITSDYQYFWAEEFVTTGDDPWEGYSRDASAAFTARCIRNLGTNPNTPPVKDVPDVGNAFTVDTVARTFTQFGFTDATLRGSTSGGLAPHTYTSPAARMARKFQYAKHLVKSAKDQYITFNNGAWDIWNSDAYHRSNLWTKSLRINGICGKYTEEDDESDYGTWRVPSAGELALMWIANILQNTAEMEDGYLDIGNESANFLCATHEYFVPNARESAASDSLRYMGYHDEWNRKVLAMDAMGRTIRLRCVRDVD
jgi:hypothetical protein